MCKNIICTFKADIPGINAFFIDNDHEKENFKQTELYMCSPHHYFFISLNKTYLSSIV